MGDIEYGNCDICKLQANVSRKYYYYNIPCDCCNSKKDNHFEIVRYCSECTPKPPIKVTASLVYNLSSTIPLQTRTNEECYWCDDIIKEGDETETLPKVEGLVHKKCAEEWYGTKMAED